MKKFSFLSMLLIAVAVLSAGCEKESTNDEKDAGQGASVKTLEGCLTGLFSIGDGKQVQFSQGNLQYQPSTQTWRFASAQYEYIGIDNENVDANYDGWIDHFGWGTSGWDGSGAKCYMPYSVSAESQDYYVGGSYTNSLVGDYANADWGVFNAISNGGNQAGLWRTLTYAELKYLLIQRPNAAQLHGLATVCDHFGVLLLPDNWDEEEIAFTPNSTCRNNQYDADTWAVMQQKGAVFFPAAGYRTVKSPGMMEMNGLYWTSTTNSSSYEYVYAMIFNVGATDPNGIGGIFPNNKTNDGANGEGTRFLGLSVRLVHDAQ